jgi:hypothetical protein
MPILFIYKMLNRLKSTVRIFKKNNKSIGTTEVKEKIITSQTGQKMGIKAQLKKYGKVGLISYTLGYVAGFIGFYTALRYNVIDINSFKNISKGTVVDSYLHVNEKLDKADPKYVKVICAFIMNECFDIIRIPVLLVFLKVITKK